MELKQTYSTSQRADPSLIAGEVVVSRPDLPRREMTQAGPGPPGDPTDKVRHAVVIRSAPTARGQR